MLGHSEYPLNVYGSGLTPAYIPFISLAGARHLSDPNQRLTGLAVPEYDASISFGLPMEPEDSL